PELMRLFERLEFRGLLRELQDKARGRADEDTKGTAVSRSHAHQRTYETILNDEQLRAWIAKIRSAPLVSLETETTTLDPMTTHLVGIALSVEANRGAYI